MEERKIGEIFEYNGEWYQCVKGDICADCAFVKKHCNENPLFGAIGSCNNYRKDATSVIFKKLEKVGKPHFIEDEIFEGGKVYVQNFKVYKDFEGHEPICNDYIIYDWKNRIISIEIKQSEEDMEEKKIKLSQDDIDWLKKQIRWAALPGYITHEEDYDRATEEIMNLFIPSDTERSSSEKIGKNLKPFDLKAAKAGKPVCTRDGRKARIICFDRKNHSPIIALVETFVKEYNSIREDAYYYTIDGRAINIENESRDDLMMLPEKKEGWINIQKGADLFKSREEAERNGTDDYFVAKVEW